jgi:small conductance mechanosensitive channel
MDTYLSKSWQTVHGMIDAFFVLLPKLILAIVVFALFWVLGIVVNRLVGYISRKYRRARNLSIVLGRVSHAIVIILGLLVSLTIVAPTFHTTDLIKVLGIGTVAIGFAFRDILQNFLAGILLLLHEPFRIEDEIRVEDFEGKVEAIETRATVIRTFDDRRIVIPNSDLFTKAVTVNTAYEQRRSEYIIGIGYGDDIDSARRLILEAVRSVEGVLEDPAPEALTVDLAESDVKIRLLYWTQPPRWTNLIRVQDSVIRVIKKRLSENGIDLPYPTTQVLFHDQTEDGDGDRRKQREGWPAKPQDEAQARNLAQVLYRYFAHMQQSTTPPNGK